MNDTDRHRQDHSQQTEEQKKLKNKKQKHKKKRERTTVSKDNQYGLVVYSFFSLLQNITNIQSVVLFDEKGRNSYLFFLLFFLNERT